MATSEVLCYGSTKTKDGGLKPCKRAQKLLFIYAFEETLYLRKILRLFQPEIKAPKSNCLQRLLPAQKQICNFAASFPSASFLEWYLQFCSWYTVFADRNTPVYDTH
jgi:hypothetical protein